jgi:hypothetical protein
MLVKKPEVAPARPQLFKDIITGETYKHRVLQQPVINLRDAVLAVSWHRSLLVQAEQYVFGTKNKGKEI